MKKSFFFASILVLFAVTTIQRAEAKEGFYLGANILHNTIDGDFNGTDGPEADPGFGLGLILGYGFRTGFAIQLDLNGSAHDSPASTGSGTADAGLGALILGLKYNFLADKELQPFVRAGVGGFGFVIEDPLAGDVKLRGAGFDLGIGADYYLNPHFSIGAGISRRFIKYDEVEAEGITEDLDPKVKGDTTSLNIDFVYHF
jgi:opacity protein-like surface antigen